MYSPRNGTKSPQGQADGCCDFINQVTLAPPTFTDHQLYHSWLTYVLSLSSDGVEGKVPGTEYMGILSTDSGVPDTRLEGCGIMDLWICGELEVRFV